MFLLNIFHLAKLKFYTHELITAYFLSHFTSENYHSVFFFMNLSALSTLRGLTLYLFFVSGYYISIIFIIVKASTRFSSFFNVEPFPIFSMCMSHFLILTLLLHASMNASGSNCDHWCPSHEDWDFMLSVLVLGLEAWSCASLGAKCLCFCCQLLKPFSTTTGTSYLNGVMSQSLLSPRYSYGCWEIHTVYRMDCLFKAVGLACLVITTQNILPRGSRLKQDNFPKVLTL